jgi:uncharacterized Zn-binding protein involved in type VI secretion
MFAARLSDATFGTCTGHTPAISIGGIVIGLSSNVFINGLPSARLSDIVISNCGHIGTIIASSSKIFINGLPAAKMSDTFTGTYSGIIVNGSSNVFLGG